MDTHYLSGAGNGAGLMKTRKFSFDIDVTGACNLRCPSCPQGNTGDYRLPHGFMEPELLERIVRKAASECQVTGVNLFNWTEPLLHPGLPELIRIVQDAGIPCHLSSNLNLLPDADAIMAANPASFKISVSGFTQEVYGSTHRGGDIELVKMNMHKLAEAKKRNNSATRIFVTYHRYRHNLKEEPMMRALAASLGFDFKPVWALMFPLEKVLAYADEEMCGSTMTDENRQLIDNLALPLKKTLLVSQKYSSLPCCLRDSQISIDFQGNVILCCGVFDAGKFTLSNYLDMPLDDIQAIRNGHGMCNRCMRNGVHAFLMYRVPEMEHFILETISPDDSELLELRHEIARKRQQQRLQKIYQALFSQMITHTQKEMLKKRIHQILCVAQLAGRSLFGKK
jgi:MoaA/NifB/PqqE/SkfB family radical SAM enzyme